jgi:low affinity Fe/Cu permease
MTDAAVAQTEAAAASRAGRVSRGLHRLGDAIAGEHMAAAVAGIVVAWLAVYAVTDFPNWMATALQVSAAAVTLVMLFVLQHTQSRIEKATQLKLDELIRASDADDAVAEIEDAKGDELLQQRTRRSSRERTR